MKRLGPTLASLGLLAVLAAPASATSGGEAPDAARCGAPSPVHALRALDGGERLRVLRDEERWLLRDVVRGWTLLAVRCDGVTSRGTPGVSRPPRGREARTHVVRDRRGRRLYAHSATARGARVTVIEPGVVDDRAIHVVAFDDGDVTVRDGAGRTLYERRTDGEGALLERAGPTRGCGCERGVTGSGRVERRTWSGR